MYPTVYLICIFLVIVESRHGCHVKLRSRHSSRTESHQVPPGVKSSPLLKSVDVLFHHS